MLKLGMIFMIQRIICYNNYIKIKLLLHTFKSIIFYKTKLRYVIAKTDFSQIQASLIQKIPPKNVFLHSLIPLLTHEHT